MAFSTARIRLGALMWLLVIVIPIGGCGRHSEEKARSGPGAEPPAGPSSRPNIIVFFTDDQGYADLGIQGIVEDIRTPNIDQLAREGVRFTDGYVTAPVCAPSRAGLLTGRYQQRYGFETNRDLPFDLTDPPFPERLRQVGYRTGMFGKLHLPLQSEHDTTPAEWGFDEFSMKYPNFFKKPNFYLSTHDFAGRPFPGGAQWIESPDFRVDTTTEAALRFIDRNHEQPFFLYVAYFAPHVPLEAPSHYLDRFPDTEPEGRRYALAMMSAVDDGVGRILTQLREQGIDEQTLIFYISDNGAPLEPDLKGFEAPISELKRWNGSLNTPFRGDKSLLLEGGIRVPFVARWRGVLPPGTVYRNPVITLDVAATALALAGGIDEAALDGTNLIPHLTGEAPDAPHDTLFWAFAGQTAIRKGNWKWLRTQASGQFLFDLNSPTPEEHDLKDDHAELAEQLDAELQEWLQSLEKRAAVPEKWLDREELRYRVYFQNEFSPGKSYPIEKNEGNANP